MSKYVINDITLTGIGDAIRAKGGTSDLIPVTGLADAITNLPSGGGEIPEVINAPLSYWNYGGHNSWVIDLQKPIKVVDTGTAVIESFFYNASNLIGSAKHITFVTNNNFKYQAFSNCYQMTELPNIYVGYADSAINTHTFFGNCKVLREIPKDFFRLKDAEGNLTTDAFGNSHWPLTMHNNGMQDMFKYCYSLRQLPTFYGYQSGNNSSYSSAFQQCWCLDEIVGIPVPYETYTTTSNKFGNTFDSCSRLKRLTFMTNEDGTPKVAQWRSQSIYLDTRVGSLSTEGDYTYGHHDNLLNYNSGITADKEVVDDATYQALKDDPDWWSTYDKYSRYNHDSAVETINSLPDTSAYVSSYPDYPNTIIFKGDAGASTDGGAINTLTDAEIAVATAKGWTISFS